VEVLRLYDGGSVSSRTESITKYTAYLRYYSLRSNTKGYGGKTHYTDLQNSDTTLWRSSLVTKQTQTYHSV